MKNFYVCKKVSHRKTFFVAGIKKTKKCYVQSHFETPEICLFYTGHNFFFHPDFFVRTQNVHMYTRNFCLNFLDILKSSLIHFQHRIEGFKSKSTRTIQKLSTTVSVIRKLHLTTHTLNLIPQPSCFPRQRSHETKTAFS